MRFRKAGTRLAATGALVTLIVLASFAVVARIATTRIMTADLDDELETLSIAIASELETRGAGAVPHEALRSGVESNILAYRLEHHAALLFDATHVIGATGDLAHRARFADLAPFAKHNETPFTAREPFSTQRRLCRFRVTHLEDRAAGQTLLVFRPVEAMERSLETIDAALAIFVLAGAGAAALILTIAVRRALVPVEKLTAFAERITARDLSQRVRVETAGEEFHRLGDVINSLLERLARSFDAQQRLVSDAAHELKTPAAVIAAEAQELGRGTLSDDERRESLQIIGRAASGLAREVDDLLELARGDAASARAHETFDVDEAIEEAALIAGGTVVERAGCAITGDRAGIIRALTNLIANGVRYGQSVEIAARRLDDACQIDVADRGPGIPEPDRRRVFERFVRLAPARREHPEGAGLGLAIVDQVIRGHGGTVDVLDREGGGAIFRMTLPA
jgi:signal transduction histidine kinase